MPEFCRRWRLTLLGVYVRLSQTRLDRLNPIDSDSVLPVLYGDQWVVAIAPFRIAEVMERETTCTDVRAALMAVLLHEHSHAVRDRGNYTLIDEHMAQKEAFEAATYLPDGRVAQEQVQRFIWDLSFRQPEEYSTFRDPALALGLKVY